MKLDAAFYKRVKKDIEKYNNNPQMGIERSEMIERLEKQRMAEQAEDWKILEEMEPFEDCR